MAVRRPRRSTPSRAQTVVSKTYFKKVIDFEFETPILRLGGANAMLQLYNNAYSTWIWTGFPSFANWLARWKERPSYGETFYFGAHLSDLAPGVRDRAPSLRMLGVKR
jgi:hypothetical protein